MAELLSDPDLAYSHGQTCIYFIISDLYFADDGSLKHTVVFKKTSRGIFENVQCFFKNVQCFFQNNGMF